MLTKEEFLSQLDRGAVLLSELPVSSTLLKGIAASLRQGDPLWWQRAQKAWAQRSFFAWTEAWNLLLVCIHYAALCDEQNKLADQFPSCGGQPGPDLAQAVHVFLESPGPDFFDRLSKGQRRYYSESLSRVWHIPALFYFAERGLPFYLVEFGAGAGLNLVSDLTARSYFDDDLVEARIGFDAPVLNLASLPDVKWLAASLLPDQTLPLSRLDAAIKTAQKSLARDPGLVQLFECAPALQPALMAKSIPADDPGVGLLVHNISFTGRMPEPDYAAFRMAMAQALAPWGDRALWLEVETVRGEPYPTTLQYRLNRLQHGAMLVCEMGRADFNAKVDKVRQRETLKFLGIESERLAKFKKYK